MIGSTLLLILGIAIGNPNVINGEPVCPPVSEDPTVDILLPHESDCTKFYKCSHGIAYEMDCPDNLYFNQAKSYCDWPSNVNCTNEYICPPSGKEHDNILLPHKSDCSKFYQCSHGNKHEMDCPNGLHFNPVLNVCDWPENVNCTSVCKENTFFSHETNCSKFYQCSHGVKVEQDCPSGLHFNLNKKYCDWPANVDCTSESAMNGKENVSESQCPAEDDPEKDVLFPHETDCSKFYKCSHGVKVEQDCPSGLHFNPDKEYCDWPANVNCTSESVTNGKENIPENKCPAEDDPEKDVLFPHETDCSKFYKCSHGVKVEQDCPSGLHFNPDKAYCDWPANVNCTSESVTNGKENVSESQCLAEDDPEKDVLFPHETDCSKFYKCSHGVKVEQDCPSGLHFNPDKEYCDWPANVKCTSKSVTHGEENIPENKCPAEDDPEKDVLFPHETDCSKFYKCSHGVKVEQDCPSGLHFNPDKAYCDWPANVNCTSESVTNGKENVSESQCPAEDDPEKDVLFPHETDCSKFYKCSHGVKVEQDCPSGLHFNPDKEYCDWPANVKCTSKSVTHGEENIPENKCPAEDDPEKDVLFPHETDCSKFYKCSHGVKVEQDCPSGLHFNPDKAYCDWPANVNCTSESVTNGKENVSESQCLAEDDPEKDVLFPHETDCSKFYKCSHGVKVEQDCPSGLHFNPDKEYCDWPANVKCTSKSVTHGEENIPENKCPAEDDPEKDVLFPHETDCSKFYKCSHGVKVEQDCPSGLHFNPDKEYCDWPANVNCTSESVTNENENVSENKCPAEDDPEKDVLFPHETDCSKFYKCSHGVKVEQDCPSGLHFNPDKEYCDWPANVNCTSKSVTHGKENIPENKCPAEDDPEKDVLFPHETDCSKFYKCSHGVKVEQDCPSGLHFNPDTEYCDWPANVNCTSESVTNENKNVSENKCPAEDDPEKDVLFPHETDCSKFYKCSHGVKVEQDCPSGLHFNPDKEYCDWPANVKCTSNSVTHGKENIPENKCPAEDDPEKDVLFPHETDCSKFYQCNHGEKVEQNCPTGLHFNPDSKLCDWPENVNCTSTVACEGNNLSPHETDCTKYYECREGKMVEHDCPYGLHFNPKLQLCDWPENVNCNSLTTCIENTLSPDKTNC